ncbi:hypothetical protein Mapa_000939 [Marchantia paleacea]|nr:hypothetical protein Mapa_000939 [Marchantia paleacea]
MKLESTPAKHQQKVGERFCLKPTPIPLTIVAIWWPLLKEVLGKPSRNHTQRRQRENHFPKVLSSLQKLLPAVVPMARYLRRETTALTPGKKH